ncbi:hypothetical protein DAEQUDRAFT_86188 [Daedalea quercina L-15889]|uniref:Uncharacterized protein n=1 Tax=Daedalea quercina L-15889 TaxID=1314783 RepID=A0A165L0R7_9APHY|nr:hypothetical protein DAEQUDRAFT_86188 [Daedalea quercina L-15889]
MGGHKTKGKSCGENPPKAKGKAEKANKAKDKAKDREKRKNHELPTSSHAASDDETSDDEIQPPQRKRIRREPGPPEPSPVPSQAGASPPNMQRPDADEEIDERESTPQQHTNISPPVQQSQHEVASRRMSESATMVNLGRKEYKRFMEGLMSALAKKCPGTAEPPFKGYWTEARYVVRMIGPFDNVEHIIKIGVRLYSDTDVDLNDDELPIDDQHLASFTKPELRHWSALFERILTACTWLPPLLLRLKKHPDNVSPVASFIDRACSSARTDDIGRLKTEVLLHLPRIEGIDAPAPKLKKEDRGWCCPATARMLCPRTERDEFDADPLRYVGL